MKLSEINRDNRVRINYDNIEDLAESIWTEGFIHPPCISQNKILIAGGRRCAALDYILYNRDQLHANLGEPHPDIKQFCLSNGELVLGLTYTNKVTDSDIRIAKLELVENVQRHNFTWQEEVIAIARVHNLEAKSAALDSRQWTQKETGRLFNMSRASITIAIQLAQDLEDSNSPLWKSSTITEALQYKAKLRYDESNKLLAERVKERASQTPASINPAGPPIDLQNFVQKFDASKYIGSEVTIQSPTEESVPVNIQPKPSRNEELIEESFRVACDIVRHEPAETFLFQTLAPNSVDHIITDPPYAIDMDMLSQTNQGQQDIDRVADTHDVEKNMTDFPVWLEGCWRVLKDKGFCIWFCDQMQWQYLYDLAIKQGFKVTRWPFTWVKTSRCSNQRAEYNFTKATEIAMIMRKGDARLVSAQPVNYWIGGLTPEDKAAMVNHPFIKPLELWQTLAKAVALPGATIADPFSGAGSSTRSFLLGGWQPIAGEMVEAHYTQQLSNIANVYQTLKQGTASLFDDSIQH